MCRAVFGARASRAEGGRERGTALAGGGHGATRRSRARTRALSCWFERQVRRPQRILLALSERRLSVARPLRAAIRRDDIAANLSRARARQRPPLARSGKVRRASCERRSTSRPPVGRTSPSSGRGRPPDLQRQSRQVRSMLGEAPGPTRASWPRFARIRARFRSRRRLAHTRVFLWSMDSLCNIPFVQTCRRCLFEVVGLAATGTSSTLVGEAVPEVRTGGRKWHRPERGCSWLRLSSGSEFGEESSFAGSESVWRSSARPARDLQNRSRHHLMHGQHSFSVNSEP